MRRRTLLAGALAASPLAAACSNGGDASDTASSRGRTTVSYGIWDVAQEPGMQQIIKAFERENPDISVEIQLTPWSSYWTTLRTSMRGGTAPDVFWMNAVNIQLYASNGVLEPLDAHIARDRTPVGKHPKALADIYAYDGRQYGLPKDFDTVGLWYNKRLFDKAGVPYPDADWTWDDLRNAARELTDRGNRVYGIAAEMDRQAKFYPTVFGAGGYVLRDGKSGFADPRSIEGLRLWTDLVDRGWSPPQSAMAEVRSRNLFLSEQVAMNYDLSAMASFMYGTPAIKDHGGVTVLPKGRERATVIHGLANVISAKSRNKQAAWKFVDFMARRPAAEIQAKGGVTISSYEGTQDAWMKSMPEFDLKHFIDMLDYAVPYPSSRNTAVWEDQEYLLLGAPFSGKGGIEQAARTLARQMDRALDEEGK
ncbi:sugar ABC transporter substrate-binding protein [Streptomyces sp. VRA16 Mangrove soil]|uniref:ABC transporter substrate-binding protein n=1 Tax=Streptomyces sp. VRA16 Mangrove soil TaxID=2817434 RepID=UPI001A9EB279|nr:sugar ABC transporter substrate-binding protein [Streptomyces sp. VRA16 Mangrove soil]MBO1332166.1 sugar ABC transporter substrate-binding protein [Streptomyces sp. VRA16 Mangrove soil]